MIYKDGYGNKVKLTFNIFNIFTTIGLGIISLIYFIMFTQKPEIGLFIFVLVTIPLLIYPSSIGSTEILIHNTGSK